MATTLAQITVEQFEQMPEADEGFELVDGVLVERQMAHSDHEVVKSALTRLIGARLDPDRFELFVEAQHKVSPTSSRVPDLAVWSATDLDSVVLGRTLNRAPLMAIEVVSSERAADLQYKISQYFEAGTELVWSVYPKTRVVLAQWRDRHSVEYRSGDILDTGNVVPGLAFSVNEIFARLIRLEAAAANQQRTPK